jgi:hypothetical protein
MWILEDLRCEDGELEGSPDDEDRETVSFPMQFEAAWSTELIL